MEKTFEVTREDNCIWIRDLRVPEEMNSQAAVMHIVSEQAHELLEGLQRVGTDMVGREDIPHN